MKQLNLVPRQKSDIEFGGDLSKGKRKSKRPLSTKLPMHLILKSSYAKSKYAFSPSDYRLQNLIYRMGARFNVKIYSVASNWNHIHIILRLKDRKNYNRFIRALSGAMVLMLKAPKGFFDQRPYTKIGTWGRQLKNWMNYSVKNQMQARGFSQNSKKAVSSSKKLHERIYGSKYLGAPLNLLKGSERQVLIC